MTQHPKARELAERNTILRGVVGSTVHGLAVDDQDDRDEMGICVEPWSHYFGLRQSFEQWTHRTKPDGERSGPGDLDLTIYSLAKWARLALKGNPSVILLLFIPPDFIMERNGWGNELRHMSDAFLGRDVLESYLHYMRQQRGRMENKVKMPNRPELIERYGFDTKYAGHVLRLGFQGIELAETGKLTLPMPEPARSHIIDVRTGKITEKEVLAEARDLEERLLTLQATTDLGQPDTERVEKFVIDCYMNRGRE